MKGCCKTQQHDEMKILDATKEERFNDGSLRLTHGLFCDSAASVMVMRDSPKVKGVD